MILEEQSGPINLRRICRPAAASPTLGTTSTSLVASLIPTSLATVEG